MKQFGLVSLLPWVPSVRRSRPMRVGIFVAVAFAALIPSLVFLDWYLSAGEDAMERLQYVGGQTCIECHEKEYALWRGSDHDLAMDHATEATVLGDFEDVEFTHVGFDDILELSDHDTQTLIAEADPSRLALALKDAKDGVEDKLRRNMTAAQDAALTSALEQVGVFRPCDVTSAQQQIDDLMRRLAREEKITIDFGVTTRFFRDGEKFMVTTDNREGAMETFEVKYVFGIRPLQQYLVEFDDGRVQCLPIAWDTNNKQWYHLYPKEQIFHNDPLHWTRPLQNWNYMCAECHSTNLQKNYDLETNTYDTSWCDIDVNCETCHGPGSLHVKLARANSLFWDRRHGMGLPKLNADDGVSAETLIDSCAPCHARRRVVKAGPKPPTAPMMDYYHAEMIDDNLYYADGQILEEDYVYTSFLQSRMYHEKVRCTDCHDPHSLKPKFDDNRLCLQEGCHVEAQYDTVTHHHHPDSSQPGTLCVECHMPETTYMVVDPRRDHSIRVPRPDLTVELGIPNACTLCHNDVAAGETPEWAEMKCLEWYGERNEPTHFAHGIDLGRQGLPGGEEILVATTKRPDVEVRPLVRASAVSLLRHYATGASEARRFAALEDEDALIRAAGLTSLQDDLQAALARRASDGTNTPALARLLPRLAPLLSDPLRAVRIEAARVLSAVPDEALSETQRKTLRAALEEYVASQRAVEDQAPAHLNLGVVYANLVQSELAAARAQYERDVPRYPGNASRIEASYFETVRRLTQKTYDCYHDAIRIDPQFLPVRFNLAMLCSERGQTAEAERHLREALAIDDTLGDAHYSLGLLLAEDPARLEEAAEHLGEAARLTPENPRIHYNYALALQTLERMDDAKRELLEAARLDPSSADFRHALAVLCAQQEHWEEAAAQAAEAVDLSGGDPRFVQAYVSFLARAGEWDKATSLVEEMMRLDPTNRLWTRLLEEIRRLRAAAERP